VSDLIRDWSDELARDPSSLVFIPLADRLRQQGELALAQKFVIRGLQRHPHNAEAHDVLARIMADLGDLQSAFDEWDMVARLQPGHVGAIKGMAFIRFQQGRLDEAEQLLMQAQGTDTDETITSAIDTVRRSVATQALTALVGDPRRLYADVLSPDQAAMCVDKDGLILAGAYYDADGNDVAQEIGASLSGVSGEAERATEHLHIGAWRSIVFETEAAVVALAPAPAQGALDAGGLVVVAAVPDTPLGLLRRVLGKCLTRTSDWLAVGAG
jgi:predicted regulator of Ras-like GTPase activity (Roadblock/LC7/MglB family)